MFTSNTVMVMYSTPRRGTLSYVGLLIYIAGTTICWDRLAFWPWVAMTGAAVVVLFIMGTLWIAQDDREARMGPTDR